MSQTIRCPDCGRSNPPGSTSCASCNFPLEPLSAASTPSAAAASSAAGSPDPTPATAPAGNAAGTAPPESEPVIFLKRPQRRIRSNSQAVTLWLLFGFICAAAVVFTAIKANVDRLSEPVEGSSQEQQERADTFRAALAKDSTDVEAHIGLANVLYDTGNWPEAIVHYRAAIHRDSTRAPVLVDLGVCYFNLGDAAHAEELFLAALRRDPHQPVALFNLGIVAEHRKDYKAALQYYHRAMQSSPPEAMNQSLIEAMQRVQQATGTTAPRLPDLEPPAGK